MTPLVHTGHCSQVTVYLITLTRLRSTPERGKNWPNCGDGHHDHGRITRRGEQRSSAHIRGIFCLIQPIQDDRSLGELQPSARASSFVNVNSALCKQIQLT